MPDTISERSVARLNLACRIYQSRLDRSQFFEFPIFSDPGWDTLLVIYVFEEAGRPLKASEVARATVDTSDTTSLRMQRRLEDLGYVQRVEVPDDRRRLRLELTTWGRNRLEDYLDHLLANRRPEQEDEPELLREVREGGIERIERIISLGKRRAPADDELRKRAVRR